MPTDAREAARRIVVEVFGPGEDAPEGRTPTEVEDRPTGPSVPVERPATPVERPAMPVERPAMPVERPKSAAQRRAQELVAEVFDPPAPEPEVPPAPTAAELAGRRIAAEAEAAQRAHAEERALAAAAAQRAAREAAEAEERERARLAREEWAAQARAEQEAEQEAEQRRRAAALAQAEQERAEQLQRQAEAARSAGEAPAPVVEVGGPAAPSAGSPPAPGQEALFEDAAGPTVASGAVALGGDDGLFAPEEAALPASLSEDVDGPPAPPVDQLPLRLAEAPPDPQLAARLVSDVLEERSGRDHHAVTPDASATPTAAAERPRRVARWLVVTIVAAVSLAVLFPLAVRAVLQLVSLS